MVGVGCHDGLETPIGNPGNTCETQLDPVNGPFCVGAVEYPYSIGTFEVTNAQYAEFLNAKAKSDPLALYNLSMGNPGQSWYGGITRSGSDGNYTYTAIAGRENMPVNYVDLIDALRFANWMNNGQGNGDTETGAYTLLGGTPDPTNGNTVARNAGAMIAIPSEDEWYKAAYYNPSSAGYHDYPTGSNVETICSVPTAAANSANCGFAFGTGDVATRGSYTGSPSAYGTFDQGGNVWEPNDSIVQYFTSYVRLMRGGSFIGNGSDDLAAASRSTNSTNNAFAGLGFRVVMVPEPNADLLLLSGLLGLVSLHRARA